MTESKALLLDAHVWLAAHDAADADHTAARELLEATEIELAALDLTLYEVTNVCVVRWHDAGLGERLAAAITLACGPRLIRVDSPLIGQAAALAAMHGLTVYGAAYAAAAARDDIRLVSGDSDLLAPGLAASPDAAVNP